MMALNLPLNSVARFVVVFALAAMTPAWAICDGTQPSRTTMSRYVLDADEVYDKKTDLTWERCSVGQHWSADAGCVGLVKLMTWADAMRFGGARWRIPSRDELSTLIASECKLPAANEEAFPDMDLKNLWYWTSTESGDYSAWLADFADGHFTAYERTDLGALRLVRSGH